MGSAANTGFVRVGSTGVVEDADLPSALRTTSGTAGVAAASTVPVLDSAQGLAGVTTPVRTVTADTTVTIADSGKLIVINSSASRVITLPAATVTGCRILVALQVASGSGVGHIVRPAGTDVMRGTDITTPAAAKGLMNTQATSKIGDCAEFVADGSGAWYVIGRTGTWTREA